MISHPFSYDERENIPIGTYSNELKSDAQNALRKNEKTYNTLFEERTAELRMDIKAS